MLNIEYKDINYYLYNSLVHGSHMSNFLLHELSMQLIIDFFLVFNRLIKHLRRFLTKIV